MAQEKTRNRELNTLIKTAKELIITWDEEEELKIEDFSVNVIPLYKFLMLQAEE